MADKLPNYDDEITKEQLEAIRELAGGKNNQTSNDKFVEDFLKCKHAYLDSDELRVVVEFANKDAAMEFLTRCAIARIESRVDD